MAQRMRFHRYLFGILLQDRTRPIAILAWPAALMLHHFALIKESSKL